jgi:hypothetical protein
MEPLPIDRIAQIRANYERARPYDPEFHAVTPIGLLLAEVDRLVAELEQAHVAQYGASDRARHLAEQMGPLITEANRLRAERAEWKQRASRAEAAMRHVLWLRPEENWRRDHPESAAELVKRIRIWAEASYPDLVTRYEHQASEVFKLAELCDCDPDAEGFEDAHCEGSEFGEELCSRSLLGLICGVCTDEEGEGPEWKPYAVLWPCPPIAALGAPAEEPTP